jgi:glucuronate isomerase
LSPTVNPGRRLDALSNPRRDQLAISYKEQTMTRFYLPEDRYFDPNPRQREVAMELYRSVAGLPIVSPHGHVDPRLFADPDYQFGTPTELFIIPDHYVFRMLYSQGIPLEAVGVPRVDGGPMETDHRKIWQIFADHFYLFRGTPSGMWIAHELVDVFGVTDKLCSENAQAMYDHIAAQLATPAFRPRALYKRFNIEVMCTTDAATDPLGYHQQIRNSGWEGDIRPCFRPDAVVNLLTEGWQGNIAALSEVSGIDVRSYATFVQALEQRRAAFKSLGCTATDHAALTPYTAELSAREAEAIFQRALRGEATDEDQTRFTGHMMMEMARMSVEDGLVMQFHTGSWRNHNQDVFERFGRDKGADIPVASEFTVNMRPLLNTYGTDPRLTLICFTLDETTYSRELAPLAGHYPAMKIGPAWWFYDSLQGMKRYREAICETAGLYNTVGFNDDTRAYPSIPARHDLSRRVDANWIAGMVVRGVVDMEDAREMIVDCAYRLAKRAYKLGNQAISD